MSLVKWESGFPVLPGFFDSDVFSDFWSSKNFPGMQMPAVNIREGNSEFEVEVAAPGLKKEDFRIRVENNRLVISSEKETKSEEKDKEGSYTRKEFSYQSFERAFNLPEHVESDKISAHYEDGILRVTIPKMESAIEKPAKEISVE